MADYCLQCAKEWDMSNDMAGITPPEAWAKGLACEVLCEGCGVTLVDPNGRCLGGCLVKVHPHGIGDGGPLSGNRS